MLSVIFGAFGAHGLQGKISDKLLDAYKTGVLYHLVHAIGGLIILAISDTPHLSIGDGKLIAKIMLVGIFLFSGSLYALAISGIKILGAITPIGGVILIVSWALLAYKVS